jgi:hypothetical protein
MADFITSNRVRQDGKYVALLLAPEHTWRMAWDTVKKEVERAPDAKDNATLALFKGRIRSTPMWHEVEVTEALPNKWFDQRIREHRFPVVLPWEGRGDLFRPSTDPGEESYYRRISRTMDINSYGFFLKQ